MESPPLPGGQARRNKLLVSWGPLVIVPPLAGSLLAPLRCAAPCQSRSRATWPPSRYPHPSQAAFAPSIAHDSGPLNTPRPPPLVHLSFSSFLHNGASMCVWHHSATACSTSERVMPRGFGSISSITLPEAGGGELRIGNSRQAMKPRRTASWLESRCPVMRERLDDLRAGLIRRQGLRPCLRHERDQRNDQAEGAHGCTRRLRPAGRRPLSHHT